LIGSQNQYFTFLFLAANYSGELIGPEEEAEETRWDFKNVIGIEQFGSFALDPPYIS
jgi:hypothetical protein